MQKLGYRKSLPIAGSVLRFLSVGLFALASVSCAAPTQYMGISLLPGAAEPELQQLAQRARVGDKQVQIDLGIAFEEGRAIPPNLKSAEYLYRLASKGVGGRRGGYVAHNADTVSPLPVYTGYRVDGLPEAALRLSALKTQRPISSNDASLSPDQHLVRSRDGVVVYGESGRIFSMMVKLELFNEHCLVRRRGMSDGALQRYADEAWQCILRSPLPADCQAYSLIVLKAIRVVRYAPEFFVLRQAMPAVIKACFPSDGALSSAVSDDKAASLLDLSLWSAGKAEKAELERIARWESSSETHSDEPSLPGSLFSSAMCGKLMAGKALPGVGFWLLYCTEQEYGVRVHTSDVIDRLLLERDAHG